MAGLMARVWHPATSYWTGCPTDSTRWDPDDLALPHVYPTVEGGVQAEWSISRREISLSVDPATREGTWHVLDMGTDSEEERTLDLTDDRAWTWVAEQIPALPEAPHHMMGSRVSRQRPLRVLESSKRHSGLAVSGGFKPLEIL